MLRLKSKPERPPRGHRGLRLLLWLLAGILAALVTERWRGQWAVSRWKRDMAAKGEVFEAQPLWPPAAGARVEFSNGLARATGDLRGRWGDYFGQLSGILMDEAGRCRRGSQEARPPRRRNAGSTNTWQDLDALLEQNQSRLQSLRELMEHPPPTMGRDLARSLEDDSIPNFVAVRVGAQMMQAAAMNELHQGDLEKALRDLRTLLAFAKLYEQDPSLVSYMIRMAILGLSVDVCWDALQANGWTERQLADLQQECQDTGRLLAQLPRTLEAERAARLYQWHWFRTHSYQAWLDRYRELYKSFGGQQFCPETAPPWRQWFFHPLWSFAWADQEELEYLRRSQRELTVWREASQQRSWSQLKAQITAQHQNYRAPAAAWRFYVQLPLVDRFLEVTGPTQVPEAAYPYPDFSRAGFSSMKNLTLHELVITTIALKRYALTHGQPAAHLGLLAPDFLNALPTDFMDGQPLRYRLRPDGTFVLYSVGMNLRDDVGDPVAEATPDRWQDPSPWNGKDWVWPESETGR